MKHQNRIQAAMMHVTTSSDWLDMYKSPNISNQFIVLCVKWQWIKRCVHVAPKIGS